MATTTPLASIAAAGLGFGDRVARQLDHLFRVMAAPSGAVLEADAMRLVTNEPHPFGNLAVLRRADDVAVAKRAAAPLAELAVPSCVLSVAGELAPPVVESLQTLGFAPHGSMPAMAVDIDALAPTALPEGCTMSRVRPGAAAPGWCVALAEGYGLPLPVAEVFSPDAVPDDPSDAASMQFFAIYRDGTPIATSMLALADGMAGIYCVATLPSERGQGLGAHLTAEPLRLAQRLGYRVGVLQSSEMGHPVYRRLGFTDVGGLPLLVRMP